jgi:hypothetical protein
MPGYEQARAEIEARGGQVQVAGGGFGIFSWLFGARGGGADDAEEESGGEATGVARGGRGGGGPQIQIAEAGPDAIARAKRNLPTGPAYAGPAEPAPAPAANSQVLVAGPDAVAKAKRNLPTGPAYASALDSAPTPPVKPQVVAALAEPDGASDASPSEPQGAFGAKVLAPLPPRRPTDLVVAVALAAAPMPPGRPADLILKSPAQGIADVSWPAPSNKRPGPVGAGLLPPVIMHGIDGAPVGALALAEASPAQRYSNDALLARAAELTLPLPPMPIPNVGAPAKAVAPAQPNAGGPVQSATMSAEEIARLFGGLPFDAFTTDAPDPGLRGSQ